MGAEADEAEQREEPRTSVGRVADPIDLQIYYETSRWLA